MKKKFYFAGWAFLILFFILIIIEIANKNYDSVQKTLLRIFEMLTVSTSAATFSIGCSINVISKNNSNSNNISKSDNNNVYQANRDIVINNNDNNDLKLVITSFKDSLVSFKNENIEKIVKKVLNENIQEKSEKPIDKDFLLKYLNDGSTISNEDIQDIWVKLLVQKNKKPNSISKRTLDIVKNLSSEEANVFEKIAKYALKNGAISKELLESNFKFAFDNISLLQDIGLIKSSDLLEQHFKLRIGNNNFPEEGDALLNIQNNDLKEEDIFFGCYMLTAEGLELKNALNILMEHSVFIKFCKEVKNIAKKNENINVFAYQIVYVNGEKIIATKDLLD